MLFVSPFLLSVSSILLFLPQAHLSGLCSHSHGQAPSRNTNFPPTNKIDHATAIGSSETDSSHRSHLPTRTSSKQKQNEFLSASVDLFGRAAHAGKARMGRGGGTATRVFLTGRNREPEPVGSGQLGTGLNLKFKFEFKKKKSQKILKIL